MEWVVKNALSRDTEREHLNKILAEIKARIDGGAQPSKLPPTSSTPNYSPGSGSSSGGSGGDSAAPKPVKITLTGDVTGEASGTSTISIATTLTNPGIQDAPVDGTAYWRLDGNWANVPAIVRALSGFDADGFLSWDSNDGSFIAREIEGTVDQILVSNGLGIDANPIISLSDLSDSGTGSFKLITRDAKGRLSGTADGTTDNVPEGALNLYYTDARADARVAIGIANHGAESDPHPQYTKKTLELNAGIDISALKMVVSEDGDASYPDTSVPADAGRVVGLATTSATTGNPITVLTYGEYSDAGWSWTPGPLFCGTAGTLTQAVPTGWVLEVGRALSATRILVNIKTPFIRS